MEDRDAVGAFAALAQEHRLVVLRLLMREGPSGFPAGTIAERLSVPPSTLSHHLAHLERAGLLRSCGPGEWSGAFSTPSISMECGGW
jgi:ArsR family transcriptional regulator, arsenate/arsenite/antimonite-responsive transcriptional repressor